MSAPSLLVVYFWNLVCYGSAQGHLWVWSGSAFWVSLCTEVWSRPVCLLPPVIMPLVYSKFGHLSVAKGLLLKLDLLSLVHHSIPDTDSEWTQKADPGFGWGLPAFCKVGSSWYCYCRPNQYCWSTMMFHLLIYLCHWITYLVPLYLPKPSQNMLNIPAVF